MLETFSQHFLKFFSQVLYSLLSCLSRDTELKYLQPILDHFWRGRASIDL